MKETPIPRASKCAPNASDQNEIDCAAKAVREAKAEQDPVPFIRKRGGRVEQLNPIHKQPTLIFWDFLKWLRVPFANFLGNKNWSFWANLIAAK